MVKRTESETDPTKKINADFMANYDPDGATPLMASISSINVYDTAYTSDVKIVGIVNDKTNIDQYKNMTDEEILKLEDKMISIDNVLKYGWTRLVYTTEGRYKAILENSYTDIYYYLKMDGVENTPSFSSGSFRNFLDAEDFEEAAMQYYYQYEGWTKWDPVENETVPNPDAEGFVAYTKEMFYEDREFHAVKTGADIFNLGKDEIIIQEWMVDGEIADYQAALDAGLTVKLTADYQGKEVIREFKVVGICEYNMYVSEALAEELKPLFAGCPFAVSALTGDESLDKAFVERLELFNDAGVKYSIQNSSTPMLDMLEEILLMMTSVFVWVALGFAVFASLMLMNFISTSISYKKREIGVLRALGARGSDVFGIFFNESLIIATINFVLSTIATFVVCGVLNGIVLEAMPVDVVLLNVGIRQLILIAGVSVLSAFLGSFIPTSKISKKRPIDAINNR